MSDLSKIALTASSTVFGGLLLFCITTIFNKLWIEPSLALRRTVGDVSYCIQYHAWAMFGKPPHVAKERLDAIFDELRKLTAKMRAEANGIPCYRLMAWMR